MNTENNEFYFRREQSQIKHEVLRKYLERFTIIVGKGYEGITYVDGFSGPWNSVAQDFEDSSFSIAVAQLREARQKIRDTFKKDIRIKCIFLEEDGGAFSQLDAFARRQTDMEIVPLNMKFEEGVPDVVRMIKENQGRRCFPFVLIDPTGWKGFAMDVIAPLIQLQPCEVLVNFMTGHIGRFIEDERVGLKESFRRVFGDHSYEARIEGLEGREREDEIVSTYATRLSAVGNFPFVCSTFVLQPTRDRTHFHLVYATRHLRGVEVFKEAERHALKLSETVRADAKRRAREKTSGQSELFVGSEAPDTRYLGELLDHYEGRARHAVLSHLRRNGDVAYDELYALAMSYPMVAEKSLRVWLAEAGEVRNLARNQRVPKVRSGHRICLKAGAAKETG